MIVYNYVIDDSMLSLTLTYNCNLMKKVLKIRPMVIIFPCLVLFPSSSFAYLDPGTGSMILQGIIGAVAIGMATGKMWWYRIKGIISSKSDSVQDDKKEEASSQESKADD